MKKIILILILLIWSNPLTVHAYSDSELKKMANSSYTPTKIEWLRTEAKADCIALNSRMTFIIDFDDPKLLKDPKKFNGSLFVGLVFDESWDRQQGGMAKKAMEICKSAIELSQKRHGWEWIKVEYKLNPIALQTK